MKVKKTWQMRDLHGAIANTIIIQVILGVLSGMMLDCGQSARVLLAASGAHWLLVVWYAVRRRNNLTYIDTILIKIGLLFWIIIVMLLIVACELIVFGLSI